MPENKKAADKLPQSYLLSIVRNKAGQVKKYFRKGERTGLPEVNSEFYENGVPVPVSLPQVPRADPVVRDGRKGKLHGKAAKRTFATWERDRPSLTKPAD